MLIYFPLPSARRGLRQSFRFSGNRRDTVRAGARGHFWVAVEPAGDTIKSLDDCVLGFELEPGASHGHAVVVADFLNRNIVAITLT